MAKYIIETDDENPVELNGQELYRVKGFPWMVLSDNDLDKLDSIEKDFLDHVENTGYRAGVRDGIEAAAKVAEMDDLDALDVFGVSAGEVLTTIAPLDIRKMLIEHEAKENEEIVVGDEVDVGREAKKRAVVTGVEGPTKYILWKDGRTGVADSRFTKITRTGRHFDQIAKFFDEVRGC